MGESTEQIRKDIEETRDDLGETLDEVASRASPKQIVKRGGGRVRSRIQGMREGVMGSAEEGVHQAESRAKGNPLAAGLIAFGGGLLAASMIPATKPERQGAQTLAQRAEPLMEQAKTEAKAVGEQVSHDVKDSAMQEAKGMATEVKDSAQSVTKEAQHAAKDVQQETKKSG